MVEVVIDDRIIWEFRKYGAPSELKILRNEATIGYTWKDIPATQNLIDLALEAICQDIKAAIKQETAEKGE